MAQLNASTGVEDGASSSDRRDDRLGAHQRRVLLKTRGPPAVHPKAPSVALVDADELRIPQAPGRNKTSTTTAIPSVPAKDLAHELADAEHDGAQVAKFIDPAANFRSQGVTKVLDGKRITVIRKLQDHSKQIMQSAESSLSDGERRLMVETLNVTIKEVNDTFTSWLKASNKLQRILERNYSSYSQVMTEHELRARESKNQLKHLQIEAIREESRLKELEGREAKLKLIAVKIKKEKEKIHTDEHHVDSKIGVPHGAVPGQGIVDQVLSNVGDNAQDLQKKLEEPAFLSAQKELGADLLTVVKLETHELGYVSNPGDETKHYKEPKQKGGQMFHLVDGQNNQYSLSKPKDTTIMPDDLNLLHDLITTLVACFVMGYAANLFGIPPLIGYICAGILIGPAGYNVILSLVQMSTLGEFGVFFVLFTLGLEFSVAKLQETWRLALICGSAMLIATVFAGTSVGLLLQRSWTESMFISVCVSLSSTTIVANQLGPDVETVHGRGLLGVLLMQDVYLGAIVATTSLAGLLEEITPADMLVMFFRLLLCLTVVVIFASLAAKYLLGVLVHHLAVAESSVQLLGLLSICFAVMALTDKLGVSNELGCFVAGITISASQAYNSRVVGELNLHSFIAVVTPVRDVFLAIFLASVGMHLYPTFLLANSRLLIIMTFALMLMKYAVSMAVWVLFWRSEDIATGHAISAGLCQVSEFAFVLASRGIRMDFITLPVYFLLLSVAGLSLLLSPVVWKMAMTTMRLFPRTKRKNMQVGGGSPPPTSAHNRQY